MTREDEIKRLIEQQGLSLKSFAEKNDIPYTTLVTMLKKGILKSSVDNVMKVYKGLGISMEELEENSMDKLNAAIEELEDNGFVIEVDLEKNFEISISKNGNIDFYNVYDFINALPDTLEQYISPKPQTIDPGVNGVIAAHFDGEMTDEDLNAINAFIKVYLEGKKNK